MPSGFNSIMEETWIGRGAYGAAVPGMRLRSWCIVRHMKPDSAGDKRPDYARHHWVDVALTVLSVLMGVGILLLMVSILISTFAPETVGTCVIVGLSTMGLTLLGVLGLMTIAVMCEVWGWIYRMPAVLFRQSQMRTTDLILIVALLGNGAGLCVKLLGDWPVAAALVLLIWLAWVLFGAAWALSSATKQGVQGGARRALFLLVAWATPMAFVFALGGLLTIIWSVSSGFGEINCGWRLVWVGVGLIAALLGFWILGKSVQIYQDTARVGNESSKEP